MGGTYAPPNISFKLPPSQLLLWAEMLLDRSIFFVVKFHAVRSRCDVVYQILLGGSK